MGPIIRMYRDNFLQRYDKDEAVPYACAEDYPGLVCERGSFLNSAGIMICYFTYCYGECDRNRLVLFCPGIGPGHTAYLTEIETLCRAGSRVLTLDYTGCGESGGERMNSVNAPTRDVMELIALMQPKEEIIPVGHSLGGYTALNIAHLMPAVTRAVILAGFVSIAEEMMGFMKFRVLANCVKRFEKKIDPKYGSLDNRAYLKSTKDKLLWIHSTDDPIVNYRYNAGQVVKMNNPNIRVITTEQKKHNPQYSMEALKTMNEWMGTYNRMIRENRLETPDARKAYFADKPVARMTAQDPEVINEILRFIQS